MAHLPRGRIYLPEMLKKLAETKPAEKNKRKEILKEFVSKGADHEKVLRGFVECMYHPGVVFDLPKGEPPPYKKGDYPGINNAPMSLFSVFAKKRILYFAECSSKIQNQLKREKVFIQFLESMHPTEAELFIMMKDKDDSNIKNFNEKLVRETFSDWLPTVNGEQISLKK